MNPYLPNDLPVERLDRNQLLPLVGEANAELGHYNGLLYGLVSPRVMLSPLTNEEAVLSSKIEGTQATEDEVLEHEAGLLKQGEKEKDIQEIINYRMALLYAQEYLKEHSITLVLIRNLHKTLLDSVRGKNKNPGRFRKTQNWIGKIGCKKEDATFMPPSPLILQDHLNKLQHYLESNDIDFLIQTAIVHAQFELIHPFEDGNGRIGRILIPLFLYQKKKLSQPVFYLSAYLESHREEYYERLRNISTENDWNGWVVFFLTAIIEQAKTNSNRVRSIMKLYESMKTQIQQITHSQHTVDLLDAIFDRPIFGTTDFVNRTGIHKTTAMGLLRQLKNGGVLEELRQGKGRSAAILCFPKLLNTAEGKKIL